MYTFNDEVEKMWTIRRLSNIGHETRACGGFPLARALLRSSWGVKATEHDISEWLEGRYNIREFNIRDFPKKMNRAEALFCLHDALGIKTISLKNATSN